MSAPKQMKRIATRRSKLVIALQAAGIWTPSRKLQVALEGAEFVQTTHEGGTIYRLTTRGLEQVAKAFNIKVPR